MNKLIEELNYKIDNQENIIRDLQKENQDLKADYGNKAQVERDLLKIENKHLQDQLDQALKDYDLLQQRIDKAKEYMRDNMSLREYTEHYMNIMLILKGDSNDN